MNLCPLCQKELTSNDLTLICNKTRIHLPQTGYYGTHYACWRSIENAPLMHQFIISPLTIMYEESRKIMTVYNVNDYTHSNRGYPPIKTQNNIEFIEVINFIHRIQTLKVFL